MISTEKRLWQVIKRGAKKHPTHKYTRIETVTVDGVSDVEYSAPPWHGWLELKAANMPGVGRPFRLHSDFTLAQCSWLIAHHTPRNRIRSWMLIGIIGKRTWQGFVLISAPLTTHLIKGRKGCPHEQLFSYDGVRWFCEIREMYQIIES